MGRGFCIALTTLATVACHPFDPSLIDEFDAGRDVGQDANADATDDTNGAGQDAMPDVPDGGPVMLAAAPPRPSADTEGPDGDDMLFALRDALLNQDGDRWRTIGFDLDGRDSQAPEYDVECVPPDMESEPEVDGEDGIDNAFSHRLFPLLALALPGFETSLQENQAAGLGALILQIRGYNGTLNDPRIDVTFTQSAAGTPGNEPVDFNGFTLENIDGSPATPPAWDGDDRWWARDDSFFSGMEDQPLVRDNNGYVSDGRLVMRLPERAQFLFFNGETLGARVRLTDSTIMVDLREGDTFGEALVTGRWSVLDLLDTGENVGICMGSPQREIVDSQLLVIADVRSTPGSGGPEVECDAISVAVPFRAVPGRWAGLGPSVPLPNPCQMGAPQSGL